MPREIEIKTKRFCCEMEDMVSIRQEYKGRITRGDIEQCKHCGLKYYWKAYTDAAGSRDVKLCPLNV